MLLAREARLGKARHLTGGRGKVLVAPAASAALAEDEIIGIGHILDNLIRGQIAHDGASGHLDDQVFAVLSAAALSLPVFAVRRTILTLIAEIHQRGQVIVNVQNNRTAVAAVSAIRPACRNIFFPVEGHRAVAARASFDRDSDFVNKHMLRLLSDEVRKTLHQTFHCRQGGCIVRNVSAESRTCVQRFRMPYLKLRETV